MSKKDSPSIGTPTTQFRALLMSCNVVTINDDSPYIKTWTASPGADTPDDEVILFYWAGEDGRGMQTCSLSARSIDEGQVRDNAFFCKDRHGQMTVLRFYLVTPAGQGAGVDAAPLPLKVHARRLVDVVEQIQQTTAPQRIQSDPSLVALFAELFTIAADVKACIGRI